MNYDVTIKKFFEINVEDLFNYFVNSRLLEEWAYPKDMSLKIPKFEARPGGRYRYEHTSKEGTFICEGVIKALMPNEKIVQLDEKIQGPDGQTLYENLECTIQFAPQFGGTEVSVMQKGFPDKKASEECETGWKQCFDNLTRIVQYINSADESGIDSSLST